MQKNSIKCLLILSLFSLNINQLWAQTNDIQRFILILGKLESSDNDRAIGDKGKAIGRYQIHRGCYLDAKQYDKTIRFSYESLTNKANSDKIVIAYIKRYEPNGNF